MCCFLSNRLEFQGEILPVCVTMLFTLNCQYIERHCCHGNTTMTTRVVFRSDPGHKSDQAKRAFCALDECPFLPARRIRKRGLCYGNVNGGLAGWVAVIQRIKTTKPILKLFSTIW